MQTEENKLNQVNLDKLVLKQAFDTHVVFTCEKQKDQQKIANNLKFQKEVLAIEWLDKKKLFGDKASLEEMSGFTSRVKRQAVVWDPEVEKKKE